MAGDIEAFLKLAAERRRQAQGGQAPSTPQPQQPAARQTSAQQPAEHAERRPLTSSLKPSVKEPDVVDAVLDEPLPYSGPYTPSAPTAPPGRPAKPKAKPKPGPAPVIAPTVIPSLKTSVAYSTPVDYVSNPSQLKEAKRESDAALSNRVAQIFRDPIAISSAFVVSEILKPIDWDRED
jgi:hypothetical protein